MGKEIYLEEYKAKELVRSFGQNASGLDLPTLNSSPSSLPNAIELVGIMNEFSAVAAAYATMIKQDEKRILDYIEAVVAADQT